MATAPQVRRDPRYPTQLAATVILTDWGLVDEFVGKNLSRGGMFLAMNPPVPVASRLRIQVETPEAGFVVTGLVTHIVSAERAAREGGFAGVGVRFDPLEPKAQAAVETLLSALVESWQPDQSEECELIASREDAFISAFRAELGALREKHSFAVLGLGFDADGAAVERAYREQLARWNPERFDNGDDKVRTLVAEIVIVLTHARDTLSVADRRRALAERLTGAAQGNAEHPTRDPRAGAIFAARRDNERRRNALRAPILSLIEDELELDLEPDAVDAEA